MQMLRCWCDVFAIVFGATTLAHVISQHGMDASEAPYLAAILRKIAAKQVPGNVIFAQQQEAKIQQLLQKMQAR